MVTATITPKGIAFKTPDGKAFMAKLTIASPTKKMVSAVEQVAWEGDVQKYANNLVKAVKTAEKSDETKTDTSAKEAKDFTNDAEKKPEDDKATKAPKQAPKNDEGQTKTDTSNLEAKNFTNDEEKKPDNDKKASSEKEVKQAADKALKNGPIADGNFEATDKKVSGDSKMGDEKSFDAKGPEKTSGGNKSIMGKDEELPKGEFKVPTEESGINTMTKGTVIAQQRDRRERILRNVGKGCFDADPSDSAARAFYKESSRTCREGLRSSAEEGRLSRGWSWTACRNLFEEWTRPDRAFGKGLQPQPEAR
jgi:hypothetical protein